MTLLHDQRNFVPSFQCEYLNYTISSHYFFASVIVPVSKCVHYWKKKLKKEHKHSYSTGNKALK